ncbi:DNA/RNA polymerase [Myriangium duriaei CBS 260.36]|uniref:DNA polymerase eta n=1 Tax=Myriangium duriaei CBS 260.36 TaxID=1168546 RepID=A0A9P4MEA2_9PEZI|nr:DNA/RNA polymerase [Myriangium duriaei CBS 260.36]
MSSPPPGFTGSSPVSPSGTRRRKSKFSYKQLNQLSNYSTSCPLRVVAHIDLDAFYAQCEMVRLGVPSDQPLAVQQWQGLIAINYAARAFGLSRHVTCAEAKKACPNIILQHVATWKEGDEKWAYHDDAAAQIATHKVSLDPYRMQSRKILAVIKESLPAKLQRVEKASIDEVFVDLSAHVHSVLLERYPMLQGPAPYDDPTELLPRPPTTAIDWDTDALVDLDSTETEDDDPDWDDITMSIASEIVRSVRAAIFSQLSYTCSAGIARNKMLAKLGSGHKKPNQQTIVRNRAVQHFLSGFKFTKIRNLGGKLGDEVVAAFNTDTVTDLLEQPIEQLKRQLGDDTGSWLYNTIRGDDTSDVNPRTQIKSMLSAKSFRPSVNSFDTACRWLRIFVADIFSRLVEEGVLDNKRRPRTINLHHRQGGQMRSKQAPIPTGRAIDETVLVELAKNLLGQVVVEGRAWPCANLSLSVGGFEDGVKDNKGIGTFLVRGEEARAMNSGRGIEEGRETPPPGKRRKVDEGGIRTFFGTRRESTEEGQEGAEEELRMEEAAVDSFLPPPSAQREMSPGRAASPALARDVMPQTDAGQDSYTCDRCRKSIPLDDKTEHEDWHFARDLQREESGMAAPPPPPAKPPSKPPTQQKGKGRGKPPGQALGRAEKGQSKLAFG